MDYYVHPTAIIDEGAEIGAGTRIWHFCHVMADSHIGASCILGQNVFVGNGVVLGSGVKVQNNVSLYAGVVCEDDVFIGPSAVFTNVINPRSFIERKSAYKRTLLQRGATIGANATIVCGVTIGEYALIGAGAVVTKNVPAFGLWVGNPARSKGWVSRFGHTLKFDESGVAKCPESGAVYHLSKNGITEISE